MKKYKNFGEFWQEYFNRSTQDRHDYFISLTKSEQIELINSLFQDKWDEVIIHNIIDKRLDFIKDKFQIDLFDIRIKIMKFNMKFLVYRNVWNFIEDYLLEFKDLYDINLIFNNITTVPYGRNFYYLQKLGEK